MWQTARLATCAFGAKTAGVLVRGRPFLFLLEGKGHATQGKQVVSLTHEILSINVKTLDCCGGARDACA